MKKFHNIIFISILHVMLFSCNSNGPDNKVDVVADSGNLEKTTVPKTESIKGTHLPQEYTGNWIDNRSRADEEGPAADGLLYICEKGTAVYTVSSNQLIYEFTVRLKETGDHTANLEFYMLSTDHGAGYSDVDFKEPALGTLVATAEFTQEFELTFTYLAKDFVEAVRAGVPKISLLHPFPKAFYFGSRMPEIPGFCEH